MASTPGLMVGWVFTRTLKPYQMQVKTIELMAVSPDLNQGEILLSTSHKGQELLMSYSRLFLNYIVYGIYLINCFACRRMWSLCNRDWQMDLTALWRTVSLCLQVHRRYFRHFKLFLFNLISKINRMLPNRVICFQESSLHFLLFFNFYH